MILNVLAHGDRAARIPAALIAAIAQRWLAGYWDDALAPREGKWARMRRGASVRVTHGPFRDLVGMIERLPGKLRVVVGLQMFGTVAPVTLDAADLEVV